VKSRLDEKLAIELLEQSKRFFQHWKREGMGERETDFSKGVGRRGRSDSEIHDFYLKPRLT